MEDGITPFKACRECGKSFPATSDFFYMIKRKSGWCPNSYCKPCARLKAQRWGKDNRERANASSLNWARSNPERSRAIKRKHAEANRDVMRERSRAYRQSERGKAATRTYRESIREDFRLYHRAWRQRNPEAFKTIQQRWAEANPESRKVRKATRRARAAEAPGSFNNAELAAQFKAQNGLCWYCQADLTSGYHAEHRTPLSRGGSNEISNIVCACATCNLRKWKYTEEEFLLILAGESVAI